jgi:acetyl-CoA carboxylase carboxyltransferase component
LPERPQRLESLKEPLAPRYSGEDLLALVNPDIRKPFDMTEVVLRLVDDSRLSTFKPNYGKNLLTCWAELHGQLYNVFPCTKLTSLSGHAVGIIGNQTPVINPDEASKGAQFIRLCNQRYASPLCGFAENHLTNNLSRDIPIIYLHNVTGFMVGSHAERDGIIKKGAQFVSAVSCSKVPQISIILGSSYGAGNYAMCGRGYNPRFLFTWPIGRCSVMGPSQLAGVMETVLTTGASARSKAKAGQSVGGQSASTEEFRSNVERESESYYTSAHLLDDGVIDPRDTRDILGMCLEVVKIPKVEGAAGHRSLARL